jgi:DUF4097 and DUF4098 domain-containing protein YvlB
MALSTVYPGMERTATRNDRLSTWLGLLAGILLALLFAAQAHAQQTEEFHQSYSLTPNGHVEVSNVNGAVRIMGWNRNEVKVDAIKHGRSKEDLDNAQIVVDSRSDSIIIKTKYDNEGWLFHHNNHATVEYTINVPKGATLDAHVVNSGLEIEGVSGPVSAHDVNASVRITGLANTADLSTVNSTIDAQFDAVPSSGTISARSVNGGVVLRLPANLNAEVSAKTVNGHISNDFGVPVDHGRYVGHSMNGTVGQGGGLKIELHNVNGGIDLRRSSGGV